MDLVNNFNGVNLMGTRACYTFSDDRGDVHVYKHYDGYPYYAYQGGEAGGLIWINDAKDFAWGLPRFEADEFAASFVAANKDSGEHSGGGVRLINKKHPWEFSSDSDYWYKVTTRNGELYVTVMSVDWWGDERRQLPVMEGPLDELLRDQRERRAA